MKIKPHNLKSYIASYTPLVSDDEVWCAVTEWNNGEGFTLSFEKAGAIEITWDDWKAARKLVKALKTGLE